MWFCDFENFFWDPPGGPGGPDGFKWCNNSWEPWSENFMQKEKQIWKKKIIDFCVVMTFFIKFDQIFD